MTMAGLKSALVAGGQSKCPHSDIAACSVPIWRLLVLCLNPRGFAPEKLSRKKAQQINTLSAAFSTKKPSTKDSAEGFFNDRRETGTGLADYLGESGLQT